MDRLKIGDSVVIVGGFAFVFYFDSTPTRGTVIADSSDLPSGQGNWFVKVGDSNYGVDARDLIGAEN